MTTTTDSKLAEDALVDQEWTYLGVRLNGTQRVGAWLDHTGTERYFAKVPTGAHVGGVYAMPCTADGERAAPKAARWERASTDERRPQWMAEHRAAEAQLGVLAAERKAKADNPMADLTLGEVRRMLSSRFGPNRDALLAAVLGYLR